MDDEVVKIAETECFWTLSCDIHGAQVMFSAMNGVTQQNARNYFSRPRELRDNVISSWPTANLKHGVKYAMTNGNHRSRQVIQNLSFDQMIKAWGIVVTSAPVTFSLDLVILSNSI